jgi:hypothetical protein
MISYDHLFAVDPNALGPTPLAFIGAAAVFEQSTNRPSALKATGNRFNINGPSNFSEPKNVLYTPTKFDRMPVRFSPCGQNMQMAGVTGSYPTRA